MYKYFLLNEIKNNSSQKYYICCKLFKMNKIRVFGSPKVFSIAECVKLSPGVNYVDTIIKGFDYLGTSQITVSITNYCTVGFQIPEIILFQETLQGSNFEAKTGAFNINPQQTLNIPVYYSGIYLGNNLTPNYDIFLNGVASVYSLNVSVPVENNPPVITDITIGLNSGEEYVFTVDDFVNHFTDVDGDTLDAVILEGNTSGFTLSGAPIISGQEIPISLVASGQLKKTAVTTSVPLNVANVWKAKDSSGTISQ